MSNDMATWDPDEGLPTDVLIDHLSGARRYDEESLEKAMLSCITATYMRMGMDFERAYDKAWDQAERGVKVSLDGDELSFTFKGESEER